MQKRIIITKGFEREHLIPEVGLPKNVAAVAYSSLDLFDEKLKDGYIDTIVISYSKEVMEEVLGMGLELEIVISSNLEKNARLDFERFISDIYGGKGLPKVWEIKPENFMYFLLLTGTRFRYGFGQSPSQGYLHSYVDIVNTLLYKKIAKFDMSVGSKPTFPKELLALYTTIVFTAIGGTVKYRPSSENGMHVTNEEIHNAWSVWKSLEDRTHDAIVPYGELSPEVQYLDTPYTLAINETIDEYLEICNGICLTKFSI